MSYKYFLLFSKLRNIEKHLHEAHILFFIINGFIETILSTYNAKSITDTTLRALQEKIIEDDNY